MWCLLVGYYSYQPSGFIFLLLGVVQLIHHMLILLSKSTFNFGMPLQYIWEPSIATDLGRSVKVASKNHMGFYQKVTHVGDCYDA
jgi:hypothetical protein